MKKRCWKRFQSYCGAARTKRCWCAETVPWITVQLIAAMVLLQQAGVPHVGLVTEPLQ